MSMLMFLICSDIQSNTNMNCCRYHSQYPAAVLLCSADAKKQTHPEFLNFFQQIAEKLLTFFFLCYMLKFVIVEGFLLRENLRC